MSSYVQNDSVYYRHPFNRLFEDNLDQLAPERLNQSEFNEVRDDGWSGINCTICKSFHLDPEW